MKNSSYVETSLIENYKKEKDEIVFFEKIENQFQDYLSYSFINNPKEKNKNKLYQEIWITHDLHNARANYYQLGFLKSTTSFALLSIIDFYWTEHIERMNYSRETVNWRAYGQQNPLNEYNEQAVESFKIMFEQIGSSMLYSFLNNPINY